MRGVVIKTTGNIYHVRCHDGNMIKCRLKGLFRIKAIASTSPIVVGDQVRITAVDLDYIIVELYERKNYIVRKSVNLSKQKHIIASNIDQLILMITLKDPITTTIFIDRLLVSANAFNVNTVLLFNKIDLYDEKFSKYHEKLVNIYNKIGYKTIAMSVLEDDLSQLKTLMKDKINLICGHSGVGKSSLINKLQPEMNIKTRKISKTYSQGQHTTTFSQLHEMSFGASIIDTPGIKGFGLVDIKKEEISHYFPEFFCLQNKCKYNNCIHLNEPNCRIKAGLEKGDIAKSRYISYLSMIEDCNESFR